MNTKADIKLIVMDMDGTLLDTHKKISPQNLAALQAATAKGIQIAICSGRSSNNISLILLDAGLTDCCILSLNGAYCLQRPNGEPYAMHTLPVETVQSCMDVFIEQEVTFICFSQNLVMTMKSSGSAEKKLLGTYRNREGAPEYVDGREALEKMAEQGVNKILYVEEKDISRLDALRETFSKIPSLDVTSSWKDNFELMPKGICKGSAVKELAQRLGISMESVMALGDYDNDLSMIACAGYGIAMENASEIVKRSARHVTASNDEDGVALAIRRFAL